MAGTKAGGKKAAAKNLSKDPNFYAKIGAKGGKNGRTGGFASSVVGEDGLTGAERARIAGARGGRISRRKKTITVTSATANEA
ncbi:hypothetical protein PV379_02705 [Streptomyces caniscabiei]|uniref:general stress protein n=1 Tax=Streptomyces caniscabiei TaxID=2746961 RepID=UPI0029A2CFA1|nr:hypothetical protein [Streptomyces caniscabiei]MDX2776266.1 hypothetical protein [Streptomyces caniscabiei]